jgi:hypothetical protein
MTNYLNKGLEINAVTKAQLKKKKLADVLRK